MTDEKKQSPPTPARAASVEWADTIQPQKQVWLWDDRIPIGVPAALAGKGGTGKTTYAISLIAKLSQGLLPGAHFGTPKPSLIWSGEDNWSTVIVPRAIAAGADLSKLGRLSIASTINSDTRETTPKLPLDTVLIEEAIVSTGAALVLIDPIASTMNGELSKEGDVRAALDALARVADETGAVVMYVRHFGKGGGNASDKMSGSHAFRDAARAVFLFAEDGDQVVVTQDKGNYAPKGNESFAFRLESVSVPTDSGPASIGRVVDLGASDTSVSEIINRTDRADDGAEAKDAKKEVDDWLKDLLKDGRVEANQVYADADAAGFSKDKAKRAKARVGAKAVKDGEWFWELPKGADEPAPPRAPETRAPLLPLLPSSSEGVQNVGESQRAQGSTNPEHATPLPAGAPELNHEETVPTPRTTLCRKCFMTLPANTESDVCDFCDGAPPPKEPPAPKPPLTVVHNGRYAKKNGGLETIRYYTSAPNGMPPQQTPKETA